MKIRIEVTDLFCGEANYSWKREYELDLPENISNLCLMRRVKKEVGWNGVKSKVYNSGDCIEIRPNGLLQIAFVYWC